MHLNNLTPFFSLGIIITAIIAFLGTAIINFTAIYKRREKAHSQKLQSLSFAHEKDILSAKVEMQENTRQYISREIHDNINLSLTLAKLYLNTISWQQIEEAKTNVNGAIDTLTKSIADLTGISRSLNADVINSQGLTIALDEELERIRGLRLFTIAYNIIGEPIYFDAGKELIIFRIIQESFNNIIKHAAATQTWLTLHYTNDTIAVTIRDNGKGFINDGKNINHRAGLKNIRERITSIGGQLHINSEPGKGTSIQLTINI